MKISEEKVRQYMSIYEEVYKKTIDEAQARIELISLLGLLNAVYWHINNDNKKNYE